MAERPTRTRGRWALALALVAGLVGTGRPAPAQDAGVDVDGAPCTDGTGVTVVVDFQELGDDTVLVRCAPDAPADGFAALDQAGIPYRTTIAFPGFLCRIADRPDDDPCDTASPADAYWSYWLAPAGGEWCYSNYGAGNREPPPGAVEGWSFALDRSTSDVPPPRYDPPAAPDGVEPAALGPDECTTPAASAGSGPDATTGDDARGAAADDDAAGVGRGAPVDLDRASKGGGSPVGLLVAAAVAALLVAGAVVAARRRRGHPPASGPDPDPAAGAAALSGPPSAAPTARPSPARGPGDEDRDGWSSVLGGPVTEADRMWAPPDDDG